MKRRVNPKPTPRMNSRYADSEIAHIWGNSNRYLRWLDVELAAVEVRFGEVQERICRRALNHRLAGSGPAVLEEEVESREKTTGHDVAAFVEICAELLDQYSPQLSRVFHHHLTSSDIVDTTNAILVWKSWERINQLGRDLDEALARRILDPALQQRAVGRTHGRAALPVIASDRLSHIRSLFYDTSRHINTVLARTPLAKIGGPTGSEIDEQTEAKILQKLALEPAGRPHIQCASRTRYFRVFAALFELALVLEKLATDLRLLAIEEVGEVNEGYGKGRVGSSSMPHKKNPVNLEKVCGLVRVMRGHLMAFSENSALWLERDISHSSAERLLMPDFFHCLAHCLTTMTTVVDNLAVFPERIAANLEAVAGKMKSFEQLHTDAATHGRTESHRRASGGGREETPD